jgi:hypothetical protein
MDGKTPVCRAKFLDRRQSLTERQQNVEQAAALRFELDERDVLTTEALVAHPFRVDCLQKTDNIF